MSSTDSRIRIRQLAFIIAIVLTGGLLLLLREPVDTSQAAHSPLPTLTPVCLPLLQGDLSLSHVGYVLDDDTATLSLSLHNQDAVDLTRISFSDSSWTLLAPGHGVTVTGLLGDHLVSWDAPGGRLTYTPLFAGYSLGAVERFTFTVQGFVPSRPFQLTVRQGESVLETHVINLSAPACNRTPAPFSPLPTPTPTPVGFTLPTGPVVPKCVFTPPPGGVPEEPVIPLSAYTFSPPQVVVTNTAPLGIQQWLPDSKTLLVTRHTGRGNKLELINIETKVITQVLAPNRAIDSPRWLTTDQTVAWRELGSSGNDPGYWLRSFNPPAEKRLSSNGSGAGVPHDLSPDGKEFVFMSLPGGTQPLIWNQESKTLRALPVDLATWRYKNDPLFCFLPFNVNWHPGGDKLLFWDGTWVFLYDLTTNSGCEIDIGELSPRLPSLHEAAWSPNGRYLLLKVAENPLYQAIRGPFDRVVVLDTYTGEAIQHSLGVPVRNLVWSPDNQTVAMIGETEQEISIAQVGKVNSQGIYLLNIHSGESLHILPEYFVGGYPGLTWSLDGTRLALLGALLDGFGTANHQGGLLVTHVTLNP